MKTKYFSSNKIQPYLMCRLGQVIEVVVYVYLCLTFYKHKMILYIALFICWILYLSICRCVSLNWAASTLSQGKRVRVGSTKKSSSSTLIHRLPLLSFPTQVMAHFHISLAFSPPAGYPPFSFLAFRRRAHYSCQFLQVFSQLFCVCYLFSV